MQMVSTILVTTSTEALPGINHEITKVSIVPVTRHEIAFATDR